MLSADGRQERLVLPAGHVPPDALQRPRVAPVREPRRGPRPRAGTGRRGPRRPHAERPPTARAGAAGAPAQRGPDERQRARAPRSAIVTWCVPVARPYAAASANQRATRRPPPRPSARPEQPDHRQRGERVHLRRPSRTTRRVPREREQQARQRSGGAPAVQRGRRCRRRPPVAATRARRATHTSPAAASAAPSAENAFSALGHGCPRESGSPRGPGARTAGTRAGARRPASARPRRSSPLSTSVTVGASVSPYAARAAAKTSRGGQPRSTAVRGPAVPRRMPRAARCRLASLLAARPRVPRRRS